MWTDEQINVFGPKLLLYRPLPAAKIHHQSQAKFRWIFGGNRSGKSESNIGYDLCAYALGIHPYRQTPEEACIWAVADTWPMVGKVLWKEKISTYIPSTSIREVVWHNKQEEIPSELRLTNSNVIEFMAGTQRRESFQGRELDAVYQDEQISHDSWGIFTEIQARLLDRDGAFFSGSMTPLRPQPWLEDRVQDLPDTDSIQYANLEDNRRSRGGHIPDDAIDQMIADWPEEVQETRIKGYFASFIGLVYRTFNRQTHVCERFTPPADWPRYRGIDFGWSNPFCCLWLTKSPDGVWYVYDEHYRKQDSLESHANAIKRISGKDRFRATWADHDAQDRFELGRLGIPTLPAKKDVLLGIEVVQAAFKVQSNGSTRLQIMRHCKNTIREAGGYKWPEGTETRDPKDEPMKVNDHALDALRYVIYGVDHKGYFAGLVG